MAHVNAEKQESKKKGMGMRTNLDCLEHRIYMEKSGCEMEKIYIQRETDRQT